MKQFSRILLGFLGLSCLGSLELKAQQPSAQPDTMRYRFALPGLRLSPDARFSAMGNVGIAMPSDANSLHFNPSATAFAREHFNMGLSYNPNFQSLDEFLNFFAIYKQLGSSRKTVIGGAVRIISMGRVDSLVQNGQTIADSRLNRGMEFNLALARRFGKSLSASVSGKFIQSSLRFVDTLGNFAFSPSNAFAFDAGLTYNKAFRIKGKSAVFRLGMAVSNVGTKLNYTTSILDGSVLPSNLGLGLSLQYKPIKKLTVIFASDLNKLMVPALVPQFNDDGSINPNFDANNNGIPDYLEKNVFASMIQSFREHPTGDNLKSLLYSFGFEFWYGRNWVWRVGHQGRDFVMNVRERLATGLGYHFSIVHLNLSYQRELQAQAGDLGIVNFSVLVDLSRLGKKGKHINDETDEERFDFDPNPANSNTED